MLKVAVFCLVAVVWLQLSNEGSAKSLARRDDSDSSEEGEISWNEIKEAFDELLETEEGKEVFYMFAMIGLVKTAKPGFEEEYGLSDRKKRDDSDSDEEIETLFENLMQTEEGKELMYFYAAVGMAEWSKPGFKEEWGFDGLVDLEDDDKRRALVGRALRSTL